MNMDNIANLPQPALCYPFQQGQAVYYMPYPGGLSNIPRLIRAIVLEAQPAIIKRHKNEPRVAIVREDGRRTRVGGDGLAYQGYCGFCGVPAVLSKDRLICPKCYEPATAVPPPAELVLRWYPLGCTSYPLAMRAFILSGRSCTYTEALEPGRELSKPFSGLLRKYGLYDDESNGKGPWGLIDEDGYGYFRGRMQWYAQLGDEESFLACYKAFAGKTPIERVRSFMNTLLDGDGPGGPSRRMVLPPLAIERTAADSEPDGADELTDWLERQFRKAA